MHRLLGILVAALLLTGCGDAGPRTSEDSPDPERFARLYAYVHAALERSSELNDPTNAAEANRHYGFTGDNPLRVEQWSDDAEGFAYCVANRVDETYYAVRYRDVTREWLGDGDCSTDRADAAVVSDGTYGRYVTGGDLMAHVGDIHVPPPPRGPQADLEDVGTSLVDLTDALDALVRNTGHAPGEVDSEALGVHLRPGQAVTGYRVSDGGRGYSLCLVHEPSGAWGSTTPPPPTRARSRARAPCWAWVAPAPPASRTRRASPASRLPPSIQGGVVSGWSSISVGVDGDPQRPPGDDADARLQLSDVRKLARRTQRRIVGAAREEDRATFPRLINEHLGAERSSVDVVEEAWPSYEHVNVSRGGSTRG